MLFCLCSVQVETEFTRGEWPALDVFLHVSESSDDACGSIMQVLHSNLRRWSDNSVRLPGPSEAANISIFVPNLAK